MSEDSTMKGKLKIGVAAVFIFFACEVTASEVQPKKSMPITMDQTLFSYLPREVKLELCKFLQSTPLKHGSEALNFLAIQYTLKNNQIKKTLLPPEKYSHPFFISASGRYVCNRIGEKTLTLYDMQLKQTIHLGIPDSSPFTASLNGKMSMDSEEQRVFGSCHNPGFVIWDLKEKGSPFIIADANSIGALPHHHALIQLKSQQNVFQIWDLNKHKVVHTFTLPMPANLELGHMLISPHGTKFLLWKFGNIADISVYNLAKGKMGEEIYSQTNTSPGYRRWLDEDHMLWLVNGEISMVNVVTGQKIHSFTDKMLYNPYYLEVDKNTSMRYAFGSDRNTFIFDLSTGNPIFEIKEGRPLWYNKDMSSLIGSIKDKNSPMGYSLQNRPILIQFIAPEINHFINNQMTPERLFFFEAFFKAVTEKNKNFDFKSPRSEWYNVVINLPKELHLIKTLDQISKEGPAVPVLDLSNL